MMIFTFSFTDQLNSVSKLSLLGNFKNNDPAHSMQTAYLRSVTQALKICIILSIFKTFVIK